MSGPQIDWTDVASNWDAHRVEIEDIGREMTATFLDRLALQPGERVLELAGGTGDLAALLGAAVSPGGSLLSSDVATGMVELIEHRTSGVPGIEVRRIDACDIDCASDDFDAVVMRMGLMLIPDPADALAEIRRVTRPRGRFGAAVWGAPQQNLWMLSVAMAAAQAGFLTGPPPVAPGGPFSLHDPAALEALVRAAGFDDVEVTVVDWIQRYPSPDAHFDTVRLLAPPVAAAYAQASEEQVATARATVAGILAQYRDGEALDLPGQALVVLAR